MLLGALLFGLDRAWNHRRASASRPVERAERVSGASTDTRIVVDAKTVAILTEEVTNARGRPPTSSELDDAVTRWIDDEVLYREGLKLGLERDDPRVRLRIAQKMTQVVEAANRPPEPTDAELESYFSAHAREWSTAELVDFTQVYVRGDDAPAKARAEGLLAELQRGADPVRMGDAFSGGRRYRRRVLADLSESFGPEFTAGLTKQAPGSWELRRSRLGFHLVRLDKVSPADAPGFAAVRDDVALRWTSDKQREKTREAVEALRAQWIIVREP